MFPHFPNICEVLGMSGFTLCSRDAKCISPYPQRKYSLLGVQGVRPILTSSLYACKDTDSGVMTSAWFWRRQREIAFTCYLNDLLINRRERMWKAAWAKGRASAFMGWGGGMSIFRLHLLFFQPLSLWRDLQYTEQLSVSSAVRLLGFITWLFHFLSCSIFKRLPKLSLT